LKATETNSGWGYYVLDCSFCKPENLIFAKIFSILAILLVQDDQLAGLVQHDFGLIFSCGSMETIRGIS